MTRIIIKSKDYQFEGELFDTATAKKIIEILPFNGSASLWGDEIYFTIPLKTGLEENAQEVVEKGDLGYWPTGSAFCIFFGPTPVSTDSRPRAASAVNIFGRIKSDLSNLKKLSYGEKILVELKI